MTSDRKRGIRAFMQEKHGYVESVLDRVGEEHWQLPMYSSEHGGMWSAHDLIAHLVDSTLGQLRTAKMISQGENPIPPDFDLQRWNKRAVEKAAEKNTGELIGTVRDNFAAWLAFLDEVDEADLDREGRHPGGQVLNVESYLRRFVAHEAGHMADLENALGG